MSFWLWLAVGLIAGAGPSLIAERRFRPWMARRWWWLSFGLAFVCLILPFGIVLIMFLSDAAFVAIREMGDFLWGDEFGWVSRLTLGWLSGSAVMAWIHRHAPPLEGPPLSEETMALARDPDKLYQAVQQYRRETGMGLAVASDVVESYIASQRGRVQPGAPEAGQLGALEWMYVGFAVAWYVALGSVFVLSLRSATNHFLTGLALFVFIPSMFGGLCGICAGFASARFKEAFQRAWQGGTLTRRYAIASGLAAGAVSLAGVLGVGLAAYTLSQSEVSVLIALLGAAVVLTVSPFLGLWMLLRKSAVLQP